MEDGAGVAPAMEDRWLTWEVPGKPVSVRLGRDVAGRLRMAVWEGFKSLRRRGLETGGLLYGTTRETGNHVVVEVDNFEPLESEHASGPSYVLSDADLRLLETRLAACEDPESPSIVGFYRSHTRSEFALTPEDASLFSRYFPAASQVFLLIKPNDDGLPTGGFIIREGGKVLSDSPYAQFPLPQTTVLETVRETPVVTVPTSPAPPGRAHTLPPSAPPGSDWMPRRPVWLAVGAVVALGVALSVGIHKRSPAAMPAGPVLPLALNVTNVGNSLRLSWDRQSSRHAGNAVLWIKDGHDEQRFELDAKQLAEGSVVYWPRNSDVNFRLELLSPRASVTESVRAIGGPSKPPVVVEPAVATAQAPPALPPAATLPPVATLRPAATLRPRDTSARKITVSASKQSRRGRIGTASRQLSRAFALPQPESESAPFAPASLSDPPTSRPVSSSLEHDEELLQRIAPANSTGVGVDPRVRVSAAPVSDSLLGYVGRNLPLIGKRYRRSEYVPPAPLHSPAFPDPPQPNLARRVSIDVKVYVNPSGKVDYAEVVSKLPQTDQDLAALAMFSARKWEFVPARSGNDTVPGAVILHYQFGPGAPVPGSQAFAAH